MCYLTNSYDHVLLSLLTLVKMCVVIYLHFMYWEVYIFSHRCNVFCEEIYFPLNDETGGEECSRAYLMYYFADISVYWNEMLHSKKYYVM